MKKPYVCFVAGRSGGHIIPALTLAHQYRITNPKTYVLFFSTNTNIDKMLLHNQSVIDRYVPITLDNFPYKKLHRYPIFAWQLAVSFLKSLFHLARYKPEKIIAMGGYISIPVCIAAWALHIPRELFELNVIPGRATNFLTSIVPHIAICFEQTKLYLPSTKCHITNYPIRFSTSAQAILHKEALATMTFLTARTTIMILGGSQGSTFINNVIKKWVNQNPEYHSKIQIIHQTGLLHDKYDLEEFYDKYAIPAFVFEYFDELEHCYQAADLIICRAGAGTLFEVKFFRKPCITIPLDTETTAHQYHNAKAMEENFPPLFTVIKQNKLVKNPTLLHNAITNNLQKLV